MSTLRDLSEYVEAQRERLEAAIHKVVTATHADGSCPHPPHICAATDLEHALREVDTATVKHGVPWQVGVKYMADNYEQALARLKEEQA